LPFCLKKLGLSATKCNHRLVRICSFHEELAPPTGTRCVTKFIFRWSTLSAPTVPFRSHSNWLLRKSVLQTILSRNLNVSPRSNESSQLRKENSSASATDCFMVNSCSHRVAKTVNQWAGSTSTVFELRHHIVVRRAEEASKSRAGCYHAKRATSSSADPRSRELLSPGPHSRLSGEGYAESPPGRAQVVTEHGPNFKRPAGRPLLSVFLARRGEAPLSQLTEKQRRSALRIRSCLRTSVANCSALGPLNVAGCFGIPRSSCTPY
jgi:hypothetical protein